MTTNLITASTEPAVSLSELQAHLRTSSPEEAGDLQLKLDAAIRYIETETGRCLVTSTWEEFLPQWPCQHYIELPLGNLQSVTSIKYTDSTGAVITMSAGDYKVQRTWSAANGQNDAGIGRVYLAYGATWPSATLDTGEPIVIRFVCGWDAASVPLPIKQAILMLASHWYRNRDAVIAGSSGNVSAELALGVERLISVYADRRY